MDIKEKLASAIKAGEILDIIYYGGSNPGKSRKIAPVKLDSNKLIARCLASNEVKSFSISKIAIHDGESTIGADPSVVELNNIYNFENIESFASQYKNKLENMGWYVLSETNSHLSLHSFFKNGTPRKSADVAIYFSEYSEEMIYDVDKEDFVTVKTKKQKPWCVMAKNQTTRTYTKLNSAIETFIEFAKNLAPKNF